MAKESRARGWEAGEGELSQAIGQVRRSVSLEVVRAQWDGVVELWRCGLLFWVGIGGAGFFLVVCGVAVALE